MKTDRIHEASQVVGSTGGYPGHSSLVVSCCFSFVPVCDGYKVDLLGCAYEKLENLSYFHVIMVWLGEHCMLVKEYTFVKAVL